MKGLWIVTPGEIDDFSFGQRNARCLEMLAGEKVVEVAAIHWLGLLRA
ncbi:MAG: hypothetical protein ACD_10C00379G0001 [uncultured bacterium]|nr:MAG: hypothetical protein ACD_10C00379G0001 [uncultured bacterium]